MANTLQIKRGTGYPASLASGEPGFSTDNKRLIVGTGASIEKAVMFPDYASAYSILATQASANQPSALAINQNGVIGRETGNIRNFTWAELMEALDGQNPGDFSMNDHKITNVNQPVNDKDAANKLYVDNLNATTLSMHEAVLDKDVLDPSSLTPSTGDRYWIGGTGVGAWSGHDYEIAEYNGSGWDFEAVTDGDMAYVTDATYNTFYFYDADTTSLKKLSSSIGSHAPSHESGGADEVNHDNLLNFVANKHIDHSGVSILAGTGMSGGGTIESTRALNLDLNSLPSVAGLQESDQFAIMDADDTNEQKKASLSLLRSVLVEDTPVDTHTNIAISSSWAYDHKEKVTGTHGVSGNIVGTTDTQSLSNKTIDCGTW